MRESACRWCDLGSPDAQDAALLRAAFARFNRERSLRKRLFLHDSETILLPDTQHRILVGAVLLQISIMKMIKHDHVVKLYEVLASRTKVCVMETWFAFQVFLLSCIPFLPE